MEYGSLLTSGKHVTIPDVNANGPNGANNLAPLDRSAEGPFADYMSEAGGRIGSAKGTTLWVSYLFKLHTPGGMDTFANHIDQLPEEYNNREGQSIQSYLSFVQELQPWGDPNSSHYYGWADEAGDKGEGSYWDSLIRIGNYGSDNAERSVYRFEGVLAETELTEDTRLVVIRFEFNEAGDDVATFWMDPDPETLELGDPVGSIEVADLAFDGFHWRTQVHHIAFDEIRFGTTAEAVLVQAERYTLEVEVAGEGSVTVTPESEDGTYYETSTVQLQALPAEGWVFDSWSGDVGSVDVSSPTVSIVVLGDTAITATFQQLASYSYTLSVQPEGAGVVEGDPASPVLQGSEVEFLSVASGDLVFDRFEANGVVYQATPALIEITADTAIVAYFVPGNVAGFLTGLVSTGEANRPWNSPWLGDVLVEFFPWVYNDLGWLYLDTSTGSDEGLWYYDFGLGWCFSGTAYTPFFYAFELEAWGFSFPEAQEGVDGRWIGLYNEEGTIGENDWLWLPLSGPAE